MPRRARTTTSFALAVLLAALAACAGPRWQPGADAPPASRVANVGAEGLALAGWDPVAYFPEGGGAPRAGHADLALPWAGLEWRFATEEHRERFRADPDRYTPAYGGWCAWAMKDGEKVEVDPQSYLIQDGRLLLFYDGLWGDTRAQWLDGDARTLARRADAQWAEIVASAGNPAR